jgi:isoleucyl-tRNA synthetase
LGNIVIPAEAIAEHGADAIRWSFLTGGAAHLSRRYDDSGVSEARRRVLGTLSASYDFFALYARTENWDPTAERPVVANREAIDRWVLSRCAEAGQECIQGWEDLLPNNALRPLERFLVDELSNWYIRRCRRRFWGAEGKVSQAAAFATLFEVLHASLRMMAPITPFLADALWKELTGTEESVHLQLFPETPESIDKPLSEAMDPILRAASLGRAVRERVQIRVRQPLGKLVVHISNEKALSVSPRAYEDALVQELNVKQVEWIDGTPDFLEVEAKANFKSLGKRAGKNMKALASTIANMDRETVFKLQGGGTVEVELGGEPFLLEGEDILLQTQSAEGMEAATDGYVTIGLVTELTPELECEGTAREILNRLQTQRKESGLEVSDRICVRMYGDAPVRAAMEQHGAWIAQEALAPDGLHWVEPAEVTPDEFHSWELPGDYHLQIALEKVSLKKS